MCQENNFTTASTKQFRPPHCHVTNIPQKNLLPHETFNFLLYYTNTRLNYAFFLSPILSLGALHHERCFFLPQAHPFTCFSAKWNWHSFFHSCRSSLSICSVGVACPRLMMSQASLNLYRMLFCICSGRSLSVMPSEIRWKRKEGALEELKQSY